MNCNTPTDITFSFSGFAQRGGNTDHHGDGWGVAFFESRTQAAADEKLAATQAVADENRASAQNAAQDAQHDGKGLRHFVDHTSAATSPVAELIRRYPVKSKNVIAHIRKATQGVVALENCHPFVRELWGRYWVFAHNGDLKNFAPRLHGSFRPVGSTDSELAFAYIMQELAKSHAGVPSVAELTITLREIAARIAPHGTFNFLLSNGQALWAHASTSLYYVLRQHPFAHAALVDEDVQVNFAEHTQPQDRVAVVVTAPLTKNEQWVQILPGQLAVFVNGVLV